jgi:hypothetical protein
LILLRCVWTFCRSIYFGHFWRKPLNSKYFHVVTHQLS